jgi:replicative DNA helicase
MAEPRNGSALLTIAQRLPPSNLQAEQALLGGLLANNKAYDLVAGWLKPEHFADPIHGRIFEAAARRIDAGRLVDAVSLKAEFEHSGVLDEVGGAAYLGELLGAMVSPTLCGEYGRAVRDAWHRRELIAIGDELVTRAYAPGEDPAQALHEWAEEALARLADGQEGEAAPVPAHEAMRLAIDEAWRVRAQPGGLVGITTGLRELDDITGGLRRSDMIVLAARPSMGKTTLALGVSAAAAQAGAKVLFVTLEMSPEDIGAQITAGLTPVVRDLATRGQERVQDPATGRFGWRPVTEAEVARMMAAQRAMAERRLLLVGLRIRTMSALRAVVRRQKRRGGLDLVVIDYLQLMQVPELARVGNRTLEVTRLSADCKAMARDFDIPVLVLSQLNRDVEGREVKRPALADLRESGAIEQDADVVMFPHRDHYYLDKMKLERRERESEEEWANRQARHLKAMREAHGRASIFVDKNRKGRTGTAQVAFSHDTTWFSDLPDEVGS